MGNSDQMYGLWFNQWQYQISKKMPLYGNKKNCYNSFRGYYAEKKKHERKMEKYIKGFFIYYLNKK